VCGMVIGEAFSGRKRRIEIRTKAASWNLTIKELALERITDKTECTKTGCGGSGGKGRPVGGVKEKRGRGGAQKIEEG